jgi:hypothetical protein
MTNKLIKQNGALINTDNDAYEAYIRERNRLRSSKSEVDNLKTKVSKIETDISEIKSLLIQVLNK